MLIVDVPLVPAVTVSVPVLFTVPLPDIVFEPDTVRFTAVLPVRLLLNVMPFPVEFNDNVPDAPPTAIAADVLIPPPAVTDNDVSDAGAVPTVNVWLFSVIVIFVAATPNVTAFVPRVIAIGPVLTTEPAPPIVPAPPVGVDNVIPPLAVIVPGTVIFDPESTDTDNAPEPRPLVFN